MRVQFNVRIDKSTIKRVAMDKLNTGATRDVIALVALDDFFSRYSPDQRAKFYRAQRHPYAKGEK